MLGFDRRALGGATIKTPISLFFPFRTPNTDDDAPTSTALRRRQTTRP